MPRRAKPCFSKPRLSKKVPASIALLYTDSLWLENCMISQSFEPSRRRVAKVLVQKLLRAVEAEKRGLKNRVWPHLVNVGLRYCPQFGNGPNTVLGSTARAQ